LRSKFFYFSGYSGNHLRDEAWARNPVSVNIGNLATLLGMRLANVEHAYIGI
jgi:hypothetical protein